MQSAQKLFAKMYEQTQGAGQAGPGPDMSGFGGAQAAQAETKPAMATMS